MMASLRWSTAAQSSEGFGGDAAHVQAGAAQLVGFFDQRDLQPVLRRANGRCVAGWSAAHNRYIVDYFCQGKLHSGALKFWSANHHRSVYMLLCYCGSGILVCDKFVPEHGGWNEARYPLYYCFAGCLRGGHAISADK
jgi:hypothetical protein